MGNVPVWLRAGVGVPVAVTVNEPDVLTPKVVLFALVIAGAVRVCSVPTGANAAGLFWLLKLVLIQPLERTTLETRTSSMVPVKYPATPTELPAGW